MMGGKVSCPRSSIHHSEDSLDVERVSSLQRDNLIVLVPPVLRDQVDLVLQRQEEQHRLLPRDALHVHVVDL